MNRKSKWIVLIVALVMTGAVLSTAAACGQRDSVAASAPQAPTTPAPGDNVSYGTQLEAAPTPSEAAVNGLWQKLHTIKGIVGVGAGQSGDPLRLRVYLENGSAHLRHKVPTQFRGFKVVTEVSGPIEALTSQTAQTAQQSCGSTVELDVFSGLPNPTWVLSLSQTADLTSTISRLKPAEATGQRPDDLGYRGFIVQLAAGSAAAAQTIRAHHGIVEVADSSATAVYLDPDRQIERFLLATAPPALGDDLTAEIAKEIMKRAP